MSVIGIDPSVDHPALAVWPAKRTWQLKIKGQGSARLHSLYRAVYLWMEEHGPDDLEAVFIERPTGGFSQPALYQANGVIQVAIMELGWNEYAHPISVFELSPGTWKKEALGSGRAKKQDVMEWAHGNQIDGLTQDEADALAIACAGYRYLTRGS